MQIKKLQNLSGINSRWGHVVCLTPFATTHKGEAGGRFLTPFGTGAATLAQTGMTSIIQLGRFIPSRRHFKIFIGLSILLPALICWGQVDNLQMDFASHLNLSTNVQIVNKIPKSHLKRLPESLPVFRYSGKPRMFLTNGLQVLLEQSAFSETNLADLLHGTNWDSLESGIYLKDGKNPPDTFSINPLRGDVHVENIERKTIIPKSDTVPSYDEIRKRLLKLTEILGIKTNEMELSNGVVKVTCGDTKRSAWSGVGMKRVHFVCERGASIPRGVRGYSSWLFDDKIILEYGVDEHLNKFSIHWPEIEPVRTNHLLTVAKMIGKIKQNEALTDTTDIAGHDVTRITLKDIEIQYYNHQPAGFHGMTPLKTDIYPVAAILTTFKTKDGQTQDAGIYFPILESQ